MADQYDPTDPPTFDAENEDYAPDDEVNGHDDSPMNEDDEDEDDYDPSSYNFDTGADQGQAQSAAGSNAAPSIPPSQPVSRTASAAPNAAEQSSKPKTVGGFILEESDEEDDAIPDGVPPPSQLNGTAGAQSGLGAIGVAEAQSVPVASVPQTSDALPNAQSSSLNGSAAHLRVTGVASPTVSSLTAHSPNADQGKASSPRPAAAPTALQSAEASATATPNPLANGISPPAAAAPASQPTALVPQTPISARLPHDKVGQLEDRIKDDPKADTDAWLALISHYREKGQLDIARKTYERFFQIFPSAASVWLQFAQMEQDNNDTERVAQILNISLQNTPDIRLWSFYVTYLRRMNPLINDPDGSKRGTIAAGFEAVLERVGIDPDAGDLWREYIDFIRSGPGNINATGWQDLQKVDLLRKAYQRAVSLPHGELIKLWKEYDNFEMSVNKANARKMLNERSPDYMTAKAAKTQLEEKLAGLDRTGLPRLPPVHGFAGEDQFAMQVMKWRDWIEWEKRDELVLKEEDISAYRYRILYIFKQATMHLRFYPEIWYDAALWCFEQGINDMIAEGEQFLNKGIEANPESVLLGLKKADRVENALPRGDTEDIAISNGQLLDPIYETVHTALYVLRDKYVGREKKVLAQIKEFFASLPPEEEPEAQTADEDDEDRSETAQKPKSRVEQAKAQTDAAKAESAAQLDVLKRTISYVWVAKMRAFRRIQGQGAPNKPKKGFRGVFAEARPRGQLSSDVYIAAALMEHHCYKDPSATKIFERGLTLFRTDEVFALEYMKHLISTNDQVNTRAVFETTITKITTSPAVSEPQKKAKCRLLFGFMHNFESNYGDLAQIQKLEKRMADMYSDEPELMRFSHRFELPSFNAMHAELVISPTQIQAKSAPNALSLTAPQQPMLSIEDHHKRGPQPGEIRLGPHGPYVASPKRPLEESDEGTPQRKFLRGDSPLKGAAGRRMAGGGGVTLTSAPTTTTGGGGGAGPGFAVKNFVPNSAAQLPPLQPAPLPRDLNFLLSIIPPASSYKATVLVPERMVELLRSVNLPLRV